ncbi:MAG: hypothetical protein EBS21_07165 [Sphingomonadaceae bacterium]|nr:hypothetical protein [Sphingomonadaceae bacterium]
MIADASHSQREARVRIKRKVPGLVRLTGVDIANVQMSMNPLDEVEVAEAIQLMGNVMIPEIIALSVGPTNRQGLTNFDPHRQKFAIVPSHAS